MNKLADKVDVAGAGTEDQMVPKERMDELNDRLLASEARGDKLMEQVLANNQAPASEHAAQPPEIDPEVAAVVNPIVGPQFQEIKDMLAPLIKDQSMNNQFQQLEAAMPGITEMVPDIRARFNKLPQNQQGLYDSPAGALALAQMIKSETDLAGGTNNAGRAHLEAGAGRNQSHDIGENEVTASFINSMGEDDFNKMMEQQTGANQSSEFEEPDSILS